MKVCQRCNKEKPYEDFTKRKTSKDKLSYWCRQCFKEVNNKNYERNAEYYREYYRNRSHLPRMKEILKRAFVKWRGKNPEKYKAYNAVTVAVRSGKLKRLPCEICGSARSHAHHHDYSKPLDVRWLCALHHKMEHRNGVTST